MNLFDLKAGDKAKILGFRSGNRQYQRRLLSLGFVPDAVFTVTRIAPFGDPIEVRLRNSAICLRREEGSILEIEYLSTTT